MDPLYLFIILVALAVAVLGWGLAQVIFGLADGEQRQLQSRLASEQVQIASSRQRPIVIQKQNETLGSLLAHWVLFRDFNRKLAHAYPGTTLGKFLTFTLLLIVGTFVVIYYLLDALPPAVIAAAAMAMNPFITVNMKRAAKQRMLDDQLCEALEFLARVLKAGHSLPTGLQMGAEELPEPIATEFRRCYDQHSLGQPLDDVMRDMAARVETTDFCFFVTAVLIQRQTGGDLAEVLGNIGGMIRARIRLQQHVKAITAEGRMVGYILFLLPFVFFAILWVLNPKYVGVLIEEPEGNWLLYGALVAQILGLLTIRKIVTVKM